MFKSRNLFLTIPCLIASFTCFAQAQTPSFSAHTTTINNYLIDFHCDLNNDGYEDLVLLNPDPLGFIVLLSNGDGTYRAPITYNTPNETSMVAFGDFNGDGNLDLVSETSAASIASSVSIYFGNGDGTFRAPVAHAVSGQLWSAVAADVNHDNKTDLLLLTTSDGGTTSDLQVLFSKGDGTFTPGPTTHNLLPAASVLLTGDFDGDGKADVAVFAAAPDNESQQFEIFSGDGAGHFAETFSDSTSYLVNFVVDDVDGDGISDLIGTTSEPGATSPGPNGAKPFLTVFYGNSDRKMTFAEIQTTVYPLSQLAVADFNGDHIPDIAFESSSAQSVYQVNILSGKGINSSAP